MFLFSIPLYEAMSPAFIGLFAFIGALFGSFFNVLSQRWGDAQIAQNDEQSLFWLKLRGASANLTPHTAKGVCSGRSACPQCNSSIPLYRNIPIISWLLQRGRSACCDKPIALRYFAFELAGAVLFAAIGWFVAPSMYGLLLAITLIVGLLISLIDLQDGFIPDQLLILIQGLCLLLSLSNDHWLNANEAISWSIGVGASVYLLCWLMSKLAGKGVVGGADQHLLAASAGLLGPLFIMTLPVLLVGLILTAWLVKSEKIKRGFFTQLLQSEKAIPAGPAIYLAMLVGSAWQIMGASL